MTLYGVSETPGSLTVKNHCAFTWRDRANVRTLEVGPRHCDRCIGEMLSASTRQGLTVRIARGAAPVKSLH